MHHRAPGRKLLRRGQPAGGVDVEGADAVVGGIHIDGGFVVEALEMCAGLRQINRVHRRARPLLRGAQRGVRAGARLLVVDNAALDHAPRRARSEADEC